MATIAGASKFLSTATLAAVRGKSPSLPTLLGEGGLGGADMLEIGRRVNRSGIGLSSNARQLNKQFMSSTVSGINSIFGLSTVRMANVETMQQQINALRATIPTNQLSRSVQALRGGTVDQTA